jgi:hypothetical protein
MRMSDSFGTVGESMGLVLTPEGDTFTKPRGFVSLDRVYPDGSRENVFENAENLVVTMARRIMSRMISGAVLDSLGAPARVTIDDPAHAYYPGVDVTSMSQLALTRMKWGTGGHDPLNPTIAIPPDASDERLAAPIIAPVFKPVIVDYTDLMQVRFTATLEQSEANGLGISEVGLFTESFDLMFCRKTFGMLSKTNAFAFEFRYTIIF